MLDGAVLALADQRGAGQDDRQHGDGGDQLVDGAEPALVDLRVEPHSQRQLDRHAGGRAVAAQKLVQFTGDDRLHITAARERLGHAGGVDIELDGRRFAGQQIALKLRRNVDRERVHARVHALIHLLLRDQLGHGKIGRRERGHEPRGHRRAVFIDDRDRRVVQGFRDRLGADIDRAGESIDDQRDQHRIAQQAAQLLDAELQDVGQAHGSPRLFLQQQGAEHHQERCGDQQRHE